MLFKFNAADIRSAVVGVDVVVGYISGVACLDDHVYLVYRLSNSIHVFSPDMTEDVQIVTIEGMRFPLDVIVSHADKQLYVADSGNCPAEECVWRVSAVKSGNYVRWFPAGVSNIQSMSLTSNSLLITTPNSLHQCRQQIVHAIVLYDGDNRFSILWGWAANSGTWRPNVGPVSADCRPMSAPV